jgi:hypothetical protein
LDVVAARLPVVVDLPEAVMTVVVGSFRVKAQH